MYAFSELCGKTAVMHENRILGKVSSLGDTDEDKRILQARSMMAQTLYIKLPFYFSMEGAPALPIAAMLYNDVRVEVNWNSIRGCIVNMHGALDANSRASGWPQLCGMIILV